MSAQSGYQFRSDLLVRSTRLSYRAVVDTKQKRFLKVSEKKNSGKENKWAIRPTKRPRAECRSLYVTLELPTSWFLISRVWNVPNAKQNNSHALYLLSYEGIF